MMRTTIGLLMTKAVSNVNEVEVCVGATVLSALPTVTFMLVAIWLQGEISFHSLDP